ncbi:MAG: hypothetical protein R2752_14775 [Vicinamibacterales bacterium]
MTHARKESYIMFSRERVEAGHTHRFTVTRGEVGWDVREERDSEIVKEITYSDWHRVERAMMVFELGDQLAAARAGSAVS